MKGKTLTIALLFLLLLLLPALKNITIVNATQPLKVDWAVIIVGTNCHINQYTGTPGLPTDEALRTAYYLFHVLRDHFGVPRNHIRFLHINPGDDGFVVPYGTIDADCSDKNEIKWTFSTWLQSTSNDNVLIYIGSHGGGYFAETNTMSYGARIEIGGDEGNETRESTYGQDVNGDGDKNDWFGVDESFALIDGNEPSYYAQCYYDDELKSDLQNVQCNQMIIIMSCCFAGGFIDDLSAPNRIIITSSSEVKATNMGRGEAYDEWFTPYTGYFLDAFNGDVLHRYHATWNPNDINNRIVDQYEITVPDRDCDGVDWRNAYAYARSKYPYDSPWFDGNGNGLPTYKDGRDYIEYFLYVWHTWGGYTTPDTGGYEYPEGTTVNVYATPCIAGYYFDHWLPDDIPWWYNLYSLYPTRNPYSFTMDQDHAIGAYFYPEGGGGGGGDGCPTLFVWNGTAYVDYGVINIHNPSGEDVIREVPIHSEDVCINSHKAKFRLREGWEGLNFSESVIDQVKLYAVDSQGNRFLCPLVKTEHSTLGNVLPQLIASDDIKTQILLLETIDLTFVVPYQNVQGFTFTIEGCNRYKM